MREEVERKEICGRRRRVERYEVSEMSERLRFILKREKVEMGRMDEWILSEEMRKEESATSEQMVEQIGRSFKIVRNKDLEIFCRYLVEENNEVFLESHSVHLP